MIKTEMKLLAAVLIVLTISIIFNQINASNTQAAKDINTELALQAK